MRIRSWGPWVAVIVTSAALGVAVAGLPSRSEDVPLRVGTSTVLSSTTVVPDAPAATPAAAPSSTVAPAPPEPPFPGTISLGDSGDAVRQWQQRMKERGWPIEVDGEYGNGAKVICQKFQRQKGLEVNGTVDEATWTATWTAPLPDQV